MLGSEGVSDRERELPAGGADVEGDKTIGRESPLLEDRVPNHDILAPERKGRLAGSTSLQLLDFVETAHLARRLVLRCRELNVLFCMEDSVRCFARSRRCSHTHKLCYLACHHLALVGHIDSDLEQLVVEGLSLALTDPLLGSLLDRRVIGLESGLEGDIAVFERGVGQAVAKLCRRNNHSEHELAR